MFTIHFFVVVVFTQDYNKLRELHQARLAGLSRSSPWKTVNSSRSRTLSLPQQHRSFFSLANSFSSRLQNLHLKALETVANSRPSDSQAQYEFLSKLVQSHPQVVVERVSHPMFRHFAIDTRSAMIYLQALQQTHHYQHFSLEEIASRLHEHQPLPGLMEYVEQSRKLTKPQQIAGLFSVLSGGGAAAAAHAASGLGTGAANAAPALQRGMDPKYPLHVQLHNPTSTRSALVALTGRVLIAFVFVSALSALLDEKGVGRGLGMNSGSKHIQQAEQTNVTFEDVKGVEEAKAELEEIVMYLKNPAKFTRLGGKLPRGLLLTGPPGTGAPAEWNFRMFFQSRTS